MTSIKKASAAVSMAMVAGLAGAEFAQAAQTDWMSVNKAANFVQKNPNSLASIKCAPSGKNTGTVDGDVKVKFSTGAKGPKRVLWLIDTPQTYKDATAQLKGVRAFSTSRGKTPSGVDYMCALFK